MQAEQTNSNDPDTWPTTHQKAASLYEIAEELDWQRQHADADHTRSIADMLMSKDSEPIPPF